MFSNTDSQEAQPPSLADIVREETDDGRLIVRFLIDVMQGLLENSKPCHRLDAARQLLTLGFHPAQTFIDANTPAYPTHKNLRALGVETTLLHQELAALIREETDNGRTTVRFLVDVMQGNLQDFKPHHRLSAAKELLRRGFDTPIPPDAGYPTATESDPEQSAPAEKTTEPLNAWIRALKGRYADYEPGYNRYEEESGPFNFETYDDEDYHFDCHGSYAQHHVLGGEEATSVAQKAVFDFRYDVRRVAIDSGLHPNERRDHLIEVPDDAPQPENIYGYQALRRIFGTEQAARIAAWAAAGYHRKQAALAAGLGPESPARPPPPDTIWDQPAEELYPDDRSPPDLGFDPPDSTELPSWVELIKEGRRARAYGGSVEGYSWGTIPIIQSTPKATVFVGGGIVSVVGYQGSSRWRKLGCLGRQHHP